MKKHLTYIVAAQCVAIPAGVYTAMTVNAAAGFFLWLTLDIIFDLMYALKAGLVRG